MPEAPNPATKPAKNQGGGRGKRIALIAVAALALVGGGGAAAWFLVPGARDAALHLLEPAPSAPPVAQGGFIDLPEMTITLANGGRPRVLKLNLSLEVASNPAELRAQVLTPRLYDSLVTYLRTLRDGELEGALAVDRLRGDVFRRLDLLLGPGILRDVLVTGFVVT